MDNIRSYSELRICKIKQLGEHIKGIKYCFISNYFYLSDVHESWYWTLRAKEEKLPKGMYNVFDGASESVKTFIYKDALYLLDKKTRHRFKVLNRNLKYKETLGNLQEIFYKIVSHYKNDIKAVNEEGIVVSNFYINKAGILPNIIINHVDEVDKDAFIAIKYFSELQDIGFNDKIPEYILDFIEEQKALRILES